MKRPATPQSGRKPAQFVAITLPRPLSTNALWKPRRGRMATSKAYEAWKTECGWEIQRQRPGRIDGPYSLTMTLQNGLPLDLDNAIKSASDLLQAHGIINNDRDCRHLECKWSTRVTGVAIMLVATKREAL